MQRFVTVTALAGLALAAPAYPQTKSPARPILHELAIKASDGAVYTGTMEMAVEKGKVTGAMHITKPTEIKATVAGTSAKRVMKLAFPYLLVERNCEGSVKMDLTIPAKVGPVTGSMEAIGCGRDETRKLTGTVELVPVKK